MIHYDFIAGSMAVGIMLWYARDRVNNIGYSCPRCGTRKRNKHRFDCQWKRYYEND